MEEQRARLAQLAAERASPDHDAARPKVANDADDLHLDDDVSLIDCRRDGWGILHGAEAVTGRLGRPLQGEVLAQTDEAALVCGVDGWFAVALLGRGEVAYVEIFEDEQNGRERYAALARIPTALSRRESAWPGSRPSTGATWTPPARAWPTTSSRSTTGRCRRLVQRPVAEMLASSGFGRCLSFSGDARWWITSDIEICGEVCRLTYLIAGRWNAGGGRAEIPIGIVVSRRGERMDRWELFPPEAVKEQRARLAQLAAERAFSSHNAVRPKVANEALAIGNQMRVGKSRDSHERRRRVCCTRTCLARGLQPDLDARGVKRGSESTWSLDPWDQREWAPLPSSWARRLRGREGALAAATLRLLAQSSRTEHWDHEDGPVAGAAGQIDG